MHTPQQSQSPNNAIAAKLAGIENADRSRKNADIDVGSGNYLLGSWVDVRVNRRISLYVWKQYP
jgi:hypothetical protein